MKKLPFVFLMVITSFLATGQENWDKTDCEKCAESPFTFDKTSILNLEKQYANSSVTDEQRKSYLGVIIIKKEIDSLTSGTYLKLRDIPPTEIFILIGNSPDKMLIQNLKTKNFYAINSTSFNYIDYSRHDENGYKGLINVLSKKKSSSEKELIVRYKALIKKAEANIEVLKSIQKKYLTKGRFDTNRVTAADKKIYNQKLAELKATASKLSDIDLYQDKDNKAQDELSTSELAILNKVKDWNMNEYKLN